MFRRSLSTAARLLHQSNGKPPAQEPGSRLRPRTNHETEENATRKAHVQQNQDEPIDALKGMYNPRSPDLISSFANSKVDSEERSKNLLLVTIATVTAWMVEPYVMPWGNGAMFPSREEQLVDHVRASYRRMQSVDS
jgi:hypothetical protein